MKPLRSYVVLFLVIVSLALFLRLYHVADKPHNLYVDEVAIGWNAYSILKTGRDEYGTWLPLAFKSFGDYKLPVYIYTTVFSEAVFGKTALAVRLPAVIFGTITVAVFMLLVKQLTKSSSLSLLCGLLLAISPWHLQFTRAGFEATAGLMFNLVGVYLLVLDFTGKRRTFFWGLASLVLALYSYHFSRVTAPFLLLTLLIIYRKQLGRIIRRKYAIFATILLLLLVIPFVRYAASVEGLARFSSESFVKDLPLNLKSNEVKKRLWYIQRFGENYLVNFSLDYLFFAGDTIGRHSVREMGMNYVWQLPFLVIGLITLWRKRTPATYLFGAWLLIAPIPAALTTPNPHGLRSLGEVLSITFFSASGLWYIFSRITARRLWFGGIISFITAYFLMMYLHIYFVHYPKRTSPDWSGGYKEAFVYALQNQNHYEKIAFASSAFFQGSTYLYFYGDFDPQIVQQNANRELGTGKFVFVDHPFMVPKEKTLFIAKNVDNWPGKLVKVIRNAGNDQVFNIWEN